MSANDSDSEDDRPRREVAWRLFAAEFDDADYQYAESEEERAPNYVVTPTGARVNRLFVVGVLTSVEQVNEDVVRARVVDPTGAFVVYAGQYQPDALASLENADVPSFVAVTGKARTFSPEDSEQVYTSVRPESVNAVTPETRDRWVVTTAERTLARVSTFADALDMPERGDELTDALAERDVPYGLASGISHAIDHYGTTRAYLAAVRGLALDASRVVAGERDEVEELALAPNEGDGTDADLSYAGAELADVETAEPTMDEHVEATPEGEAVTDEPEPSPDDFESDAGDTEGEATEAEADETEAATADAETATADVESVRTEATPEGETATDEAEPSPDVDDSRSESSANQNARRSGDDFEPDADDTTASDATDAATADTEEGASEVDADDDEQWEMDEETRAEVEEEFDVGFSSGTEIPESDGNDESDRSPDDAAAADETGSSLGDFEPADDEPEDQTSDDYTEDAYDEPESDASDAESPPADLDLEDLVVDYMDELDDGDGAERDDLVRTVVEETDADEDEIADAIQSALMSGRCYESGDDHLKAI
ncbi:hypothetical protein EFA46_010225 [Halarchaeum sp. CBA1220]|uniref:hypothetical protein n=1 Tax=Halarchaeum sp. CBA1220 TaxID=1853682 RepID=UPI000F3AA3D5|nr:hypothetical protein [Halarchaeum sp. CBA1220]QLC34564.1 hypothetical protein EFA46_010225 [Halarchaeum sp. CBA1220]